ncbi:DUF1127 domain-containing protein [Amphritea atlantica]|uniref:DUF1127 domain-containing protein n=1 Tax=Amphritea atlantica TaxID=355243 RepID=A0ABY5GYN9_9GAMM|nr:DUF1127 domain-containing protein [Amphritea atlantica]
MKTIVLHQQDIGTGSKEKLSYWSAFQRWLQRYRSRRMLQQLDREQLKDIGITREEALEEVRKPFWR